MMQPGRKFSQSTKYRFGFNGKENDNDVKGEGNQQDYGMRIYEGRLSRFLSVDPLSKQYPFYTPYQFSGNSPILNVDLDGLEPMNAWVLSKLKNAPPGKTPAAKVPKSNSISLAGAKITSRAKYIKTGGGTALDVLANAKEFGANVGISAWNGVVEQTQDVTNLAFSSSGRKEVIDNYSTSLLSAAIWSGTTTASEKLQDGKNFVSDIENVENLAATGFLFFTPGIKQIMPRMPYAAGRHGVAHIYNAVVKGERVGSAGYKSLDASDAHHFFSNIIDNYASNATKFSIKGGDDIVRTLYQIDGSLNGKSGIFEWLVEGNKVNHRRFIEGGVVNGKVNQIVK